ncbi:MAG: hypothetical protein AAFX57_02445, partial [Bacteroidota bacterium]
FFGFIASILTFISGMGITIETLLPMIVSWLAYDSVLYPIGVVVVCHSAGIGGQCHLPISGKLPFKDQCAENAYCHHCSGHRLDYRSH